MVAREPAGERVVTVGRVSDCERCRGSLDVVSEQRVSMTPPVFDLECRCPACGHRVRVRQVLTHFE
jgi:hypothetical protein